MIPRLRPLTTTRPPPFLLTTKHPFSSSSPSNAPKTILLIGSNGALGQSFSQTAPPRTTIVGADVTKPHPSSNVDNFIRLPSPTTSVTSLTAALREGLSRHRGQCFDAVVCTAGGWRGDPARGEEEGGVEGYARGVDEMLGMNLFPAVAAGLISMERLKLGGLFVSIGATAALQGTPNMLGYGLSKAGVHHVISTLTPSQTTSSQSSSLTDAFSDLCAVGVLPNVLNTPQNRKAMPDADWEYWTDVDDVSKEIWSWVETPYLRPAGGSLVKVYNRKGGGVKFEMAR